MHTFFAAIGFIAICAAVVLFFKYYILSRRTQILESVKQVVKKERLK